MLFNQTATLAAEHDTIEAYSWLEKGNDIYRSNIDSAEFFWGKANKEASNLLNDSITMSVKIKNAFLNIKVQSYANLAYVYSKKGKKEKSLKMYKYCVPIFKQLGKYHDLSSIYNNMALEFSYRAMLDSALFYYGLSLSIREFVNDSAGVAWSYSNLGSIYFEQKEDSIALNYHYKALTIFKKINNEDGIGMSYSHIGNHYRHKNKFDSAIYYFDQSVIYYKKISYVEGIASSFNNIGSIYLDQNIFDSALYYYNKSLILAQSQTNKKRICRASINIAKTYYLKGDMKNAIKYANASMDMAEELKYPGYLSSISLLKSEINEDSNNFKEALEFYKLHITMRDSINNEKTQKAVIQQQAKYEYEKQKAVDDAEHEKQIAIEQEAKEKQTIITYATGGGLGLVGIFLLIVFNRLKVTRKQKNIIEEQKQEVEEQKTVVELAHFELEEKNKEITDSIQYAKRIQNAILPPNKVVKEYLQESFIYYKPKDIVAGDFYWLETVSSFRHAELDSTSKEEQIPKQVWNDDSIVLFAAADCTGHGVPGAMVSVVCNNGLNRSVREHGLTDPGEILDKTREIVIQEFEKSEDEVKDGMDIALCSLSVDSNQSTVLKYAGAHNPLWIISKKSSLRGGSEERAGGGSTKNIKPTPNPSQEGNFNLFEIKANKQPIGQFDNPEPYITHTIQLQKGDSFYIFSDGYADQFGGEKGKKYKTANFKKLLLSIQKEDMQKQKQLINEAFENWKGELEQLDDVCVIGVRV